MTLGEKIRIAREQKGWSQAELGNRIETTQQNIQRLEEDKVKHSRFLLPALSALGLDPAAELPQNVVKPPVQFLGARDLPVFSSVEGGPGEIHFGGNLHETVPRPWFVANSPDAYAVLVVGESMVPVIRPGQMVVVNPALGPIPGEPAIFSSDEDGEFRATIKEFKKSSADAWLVYQYNPPDGQNNEIKLEKKRWPKAVRVVGVFAGR
jgi:phage repressor protein C with HTH and peptisase S24 domain